MIIVPGAPPVQETKHSRELGRRIEQVVREYQRDNPDVSLSDVRIALMQRTPGGDAPDLMRRKRVLVAAIAAVAVGVFTAISSTEGRLELNSQMWLIIAAVAAILGVTIAVIRTVRRS